MCYLGIFLLYNLIWLILPARYQSNALLHDSASSKGTFHVEHSYAALNALAAMECKQHLHDVGLAENDEL